MELANIEKIIEKYVKAETTLKEEETLKNYFKQDNVATHLQEYKYMFNYFDQSKTNIYTKEIKLKPKKTKRQNLKWLSLVACVVFGIFMINKAYNRYKINKQYAQVESALKMLSINLKKGENAVATLYVYEDTVKKILK